MTYLYFDNILLNGFRSGPLSPSAGTPPVALLGRQAILGQAKIARTRIKRGRSERSSLLVGLRGIGRTVFLRTISDRTDQI